MLANLNLSRISPEFLIDQNNFLPFLSYTVVQYLMTWFLIIVRQEVKRIDKSVVDFVKTHSYVELPIDVTNRTSTTHVHK